MKERPILFSAPMVRALLDGSKTQTRRVIKPHPRDDAFCLLDHGEGWWPYRSEDGESANVDNMEYPFVCPYGQPGDRLWVRETWQGPLFDDKQDHLYREDPTPFQNPQHCVYAADGGDAPEFMTMDDELVCRWRPSIHMNRWASRILLEVVSVRVERLNDCSKSDALAEGIHSYEHFWRDCEYSIPDIAYEPVKGARIRYSCPVQAYQALWESINGAGSWDANPWVWVVEFKRVAPSPLET